MVNRKVSREQNLRSLHIIRALADDLNFSQLRILSKEFNDKAFDMAISEGQRLHIKY